MNLLRRLFGGGDATDRVAGGDTPHDGDAQRDGPGASSDDLELQHEREIMRSEAERLDELQQRQLRFADRAWTPPRQGGERRADDADAAKGTD
jgi:hypothetical protein